jgi:hypothetical protein
LLASRLFFSRNRGYPTALLSVIPYDNVEEKARQERKRAEVNHWLRIFKQPVRDWRGVSYKKHFQQVPLDDEEQGEDEEEGGGGGGGEGASKGLFGDHEEGECFRHDPGLLDDPGMTQGKHRYILRGDAATGPVMTSVGAVRPFIFSLFLTAPLYLPLSVSVGLCVSLITSKVYL